MYERKIMEYFSLNYFASCYLIRPSILFHLYDTQPTTDGTISQWTGRQKTGIIPRLSHLPVHCSGWYPPAGTHLTHNLSVLTERKNEHHNCAQRQMASGLDECEQVGVIAPVDKYLNSVRIKGAEIR